MNAELPPLLIDRAAAARRLEPGELASWAAEQRVFISSVMANYGDPRQAAAQAIESVGAYPVMFERFGGRDDDPEGAYLSEVESSTIYVGLLGERYGRPLPSHYSATHTEYLHAEERGLRVSVWAEEGVDREGPAQSFLDEVQTFTTTGGFSTPDELEGGLVDRLKAIAAEDLSPWVKIGRCLVRAEEVTVKGNEVNVTTVVRDNEVTDELAALTDRFGRSTTTLAYFDGVYDVRVNDIESASRTGNARRLTLSFEASAPSAANEYSFNGVDWADATKIAIEVSWFGAENPFGGFSAGEAAISNPFAQLAESRVGDEAYRPIARLLAGEILARERNVSRVTRFQLGRAIRGQRALHLQWRQPSQYAGHEAATLEASGQVAV